MGNAYNKVEWSFLENVMNHMRFTDKWVSLMRMCITIVSYSILVNGVSHGPITPFQGLRQRDPLSPYLFLLCVEGLVSLLKKAKNDGCLWGIQLCRGFPLLNNLFFVDDCILFCRAIPYDNIQIQNLLQQYEEASGQQVNREKTSNCFSQNTPTEIWDCILGVWNVERVVTHDKYLGLPSFIGQLKRSFFSDHIKD